MAKKSEDHEVRRFPAICAYLQYAVLIFFGHLRDIVGGFLGNSRYLAKRPQPGYANMLVSWENFYTKRVYHRIQDVFNRPITKTPGAHMLVCERHTNDGNRTLHITPQALRPCINLGSYNYLGFADDWMSTCAPGVLPYLDTLPLALSTSAMDATTSLHVELESLVAQFLGQEDALIYNMGYATNSTTIPALVGKGCLLVSDTLNHASIVNGARSAQAITRTFAHNDPMDLERVLRRAIAYGQPRTRRPWKKIVVMVEGIYSMEGEILDLQGIVAVTKRYKAYLYVDEAHSIGALGGTGRGVCEYDGVSPSDIDILMGTFTKSFAGMGGYIAGSRELIRQLRRASAGSLYAPALSPLVVAQIRQALLIIMGRRMGDLGVRKIAQLRTNANYFRERLEAMGVACLGKADSPVVPMLLYTPSKVAAYSRECFDRGLAVVTVGFPATPLLLGRARFCLSAGHSREDLDTALACIAEVVELCGVRYQSRACG